LPKAYWIGTLTGPWEVQPDDAIGAVPRVKLLRLAAQNRAQLQAEWSGVASYGIKWIKNSTHIQGLNASGPPRTVEAVTGAKRVGRKKLSQWADFKYYVNLDGVVMGGRLNKLFALGGVVLQHQAGYYEHMTALAKPYEHYVPIAYDLSDLIPKIKWLQSNDGEAEKIARQGRELFSRRMRLEDDLCYTWRALEALGSKTSSAEVDPQAVERRLRELNFTRVSVKGPSMRQTLESFWGGKLEEVSLGRRKMTDQGVKLLEWAWSRFGALYDTAHDNATGSLNSRPWLD
jgi:hypothetical protein